KNRIYHCTVLILIQLQYFHYYYFIFSRTLHFLIFFFFFFFNDTATTEIYTLSLHDALPIYDGSFPPRFTRFAILVVTSLVVLLRSEEHTSELQSQSNLVCRLLLEKKKNTQIQKPFLLII